MIRKGGTLLDACEVITVASVDGKGYPRPVPVVKLAAEDAVRFGLQPGPVHVKLHSSGLIRKQE